MTCKTMCIQNVLSVFQGVWVHNSLLYIFYSLMYGRILQSTCVYEMLCLLVTFFLKIVFIVESYYSKTSYYN
jgi:hypothetical protein